MADSLSFVVQLTDAVSGPAGSAAAAMTKLSAAMDGAGKNGRKSKDAAEETAKAQEKLQKQAEKAEKQEAARAARKEKQDAKEALAARKRELGLGPATLEEQAAKKQLAAQQRTAREARAIERETARAALEEKKKALGLGPLTLEERAEKKKQAAAKAAAREAANNAKEKKAADDAAKSAALGAIGAVAGVVAAYAAAGLAAVRAAYDFSAWAFTTADRTGKIKAAWTRLEMLRDRLFKKINVEPIARAIDKFAIFFDTSTVSGKILEEQITKLFNGIGGLVERLSELSRPFMEGLLIGFLQVELAVLRFLNSPLGAALRSWAAEIAPTTAQLTMLGQVLAYGVAFAASSAVAPLLAVGSYIALIARGVLGAVQVFQALIGAIGGAVSSLSALGSSIAGALGEMAASGANIASDFVNGLVSGITNGIARVVDAARSLGSAAASTIKSVLGIASPSRVMIGFGANTAEGFAQGMEAGEGRVASASGGMAAAPLAAASAGASGGAARSSSVSLGGVTITINGVAGADQILDRLPAVIADAFEQMALSMGAPTNA